MSDPVIELSGAAFGYGDRTVVSDLDLTVLGERGAHVVDDVVGAHARVVVDDHEVTHTSRLGPLVRRSGLLKFRWRLELFRRQRHDSCGGNRPDPTVELGLPDRVPRSFGVGGGL